MNIIPENATKILQDRTGSTFLQLQIQENLAKLICPARSCRVKTGEAK